MTRQKVTLARLVAYDALTLAAEEGVAPTEAVERLAVERPALKNLDRRFIKELVWGSLRWYSKMLWILNHTAERDLKEAAPEIRTALIMGTYQIFYMDRVPDRAAVSQSVEYIRQKGLHQAVGFVNGILRSIARRSKYFQKPDKDAEPVAYLALQFATPPWIVARWHKKYGYEKCQEILQGINKPSPVCLRVNSLKTPEADVRALQTRLLKECQVKTRARPHTFCLSSDFMPSVQESVFKEGYITIQGEASQVVSSLVDPAAEEVIYDVCCGPGGKTLGIYEASLAKATVIGMDQSKNAIERAQENADRLGHPVQFECQNFMEWRPEGRCDKILLDAPCSGLGVLQKHPEGKLHKTETFLMDMANQQREMITHALDVLPSGGKLIYSVCSFEPEESEEHLAWIKKTYSGKIEVETPIRFLPNYYKKFVTRDNIFLVQAGHKEGMDGFAAFVVKKL